MRAALLCLRENKPNLIFRKAKITGSSVERLLQYVSRFLSPLLRNAKIPVPRIKGEALFGIYPVLESLEMGKRTASKLYIKDSVR